MRTDNPFNDPTAPRIFTDYAELEEWAWKLHDALAVERDRAKADPDHLLSVAAMRRIAAMDAALYGFEEWAR
jgi:hypothetical protein